MYSSTLTLTNMVFRFSHNLFACMKVKSQLGALCIFLASLNKKQNKTKRIAPIFTSDLYIQNNASVFVYITASYY